MLSTINKIALHDLAAQEGARLNSVMVVKHATKKRKSHTRKVIVRERRQIVRLSLKHGYVEGARKAGTYRQRARCVFHKVIIKKVLDTSFRGPKLPPKQVGW